MEARKAYLETGYTKPLEMLLRIDTATPLKLFEPSSPYTSKTHDAQLRLVVLDRKLNG